MAGHDDFLITWHVRSELSACTSRDAALRPCTAVGALGGMAWRQGRSLSDFGLKVGSALIGWTLIGPLTSFHIRDELGAWAFLPTETILVSLGSP